MQKGHRFTAEAPGLSLCSLHALSVSVWVTDVLSKLDSGLGIWQAANFFILLFFLVDIPDPA